MTTSILKREGIKETRQKQKTKKVKEGKKVKGERKG